MGDSILPFIGAPLPVLTFVEKTENEDATDRSEPVVLFGSLVLQRRDACLVGKIKSGEYLYAFLLP